MNEIIGKWVQREDQPYAGLVFEFKADGTFLAEYASMAIFSSGTYSLKRSHLDMNQTSHSFGMTGDFKGLVSIEGDMLKMALSSGPGQPRPENFDQSRIYIKQ